MKYTEEELKILQQLMPGKFQQEAQATQQQQPQLPEIKLPEPELKSSGLDAFTTGLKQGLFADAPGSAWSVLKDLTPTGLGLDPYYNQKIQENIEQGQAYQEQLTPEAQQSMAYTAGSSIGGIAPVAAGAVLTAPFSGGASAAALFGGMTGLNVGGNTYEFEQRRRAELLQSNPNLTEEQIQAEVDLGRKQVALESLPLAAGEAAATMLTGGLGRGAKTVLGGAAKSALADAPINIASAGLQESIVGGALEGGVDEELRKEKMIMGGITGGIVSGVMGGIEAAKKKSIPLPNDIAQKRAEALNQIAPAGINYETRPATDKDGNVIQGRSEVWEVNNRKPEVAVEQPIETPITQKPVEEVQPTDANAIPKVEEEEVKPADVAPKVEETQIDAEKTQEIQTVEQPQQDNQTVSKTDAKSIEIPVQNLTKDNFVSNGVDLPETTTFEQRTIKTRELDPITNKAKNIEKTINVASDRDNLGFGLTLNQTLADKQNLETKGKADVITPIKTSKLNLDTLSDNFVYKKYLKEGETALNSGANLLVARNKNIKERVIGSYDFYDRSVVKDNQGNKALEFVASINPSKFEPYLTNVRNIKDTDEVFLVREKTEQFPENTAVYVNTVNEKTKQVETVKVAKLERNVAREVAKFLDANGIDNIEVKLGAVEMPYSKKAEQDFSRQSYTRMNEKGEKETIMARTIIAGRINLNKNADNVLNQISKEKPIKQIDNVVEKQQSQVPVDEKAVEIENNLKKLNASNQKIKVYFDYNGSEGKYTGKDLEELNQFRKQQKELKANGIFSPEDNVVYLSYEQIAKNAKKNGIPVEEMVEFVYTHEVLGHGSMKVFFKSDEELNKFLDAEILKAEKEDGIIKYLMDNKAKTYKNADKRELIEEVFADLANGKVKVKEGEEYVIKDITQLSKEFAVLKKLTREQEAGIVRGLINAIKDLFDKLTGNDNFQVRQEKKSENQLLNAYNELKQMQKALEGSSVKDNADNVAISDKLKFEKEDKFNDKNYALSQLKNRGQDLDLYSEKIRDDEDVVLIAVQDLPSSFRYASDRLKDNKEFALKILNFNGGLYFNLSRKLQNDKEIILKSLKNYKFIFEDIPVLLKNKYGNDIDDFIVNIEKDIKAEKFAENLDQTLAKKPEETAVAKKKPVKLDKEIDWDNKEEVLAQVKNAGYTLMYASDKLRDNKEVVKNAVKSSGASLEYSSDRLKDDKYIVSQAIKENGLALGFASNRLKDDKELVLEAMKENIGAIQYASNRLKDDKELVLTAVKEAGEYLTIASNRLKDDDEVVKTAFDTWNYSLRKASDRLKVKYVKENPENIKYVGYKEEGEQERIQKLIDAEKFAENLDKTLAKKSEETAVAKKKPVKLDREIDWDNKEEVLRAVEKWPSALKYAPEKTIDNKDFILEALSKYRLFLDTVSDRLKDDKDVVLASVEKNPSYLQYASDRLKDDKEVVFEVVKNNGYYFTFASDKLKNDKDFILSLVKNIDEKQFDEVFKHLPNNLVFDKEINLEVAKKSRYNFVSTLRDEMAEKYGMNRQEFINNLEFEILKEKRKAEAENLDKTLAKKPEETAVAKKKPMKLDTEEKYVPIKDIVSKNISDEEKNKIIKNAKQNIEKQLKELNENYAHSDIGLVITYKNKRGLTPLEKEIVAKHNKDNFGGPGLFLEHEGKNYISINIDNVINSPLAKELSFEDYAKFVYGHEMIGHGAIGNKFKTNEEKLKFLMKIYRNSSPIFKNLVTKKEDLYPENLGTRIEEVLADLSVGKVSYYNDKNEIVVKSIEQYAYDFSYELAKSQNIGRPEALKQIMVDLMNAIKTAINEFTGTPIFKVYSTIKDELSTIKQELKDIQQELGISSKELFEANKIKYKLDKEEAILVGKISENPDYLKSQEYQSINNSKISLFINNFIPSSASIPWIGDMFNKAMSNEAFKGGFDIMTRIGDTDKTIDYHFQKMMKNIYNEKFGWKTGLKKKEKEVLNKALFETMMSNGKFSEKDLIQKFGMNDKTVIAYNDLIDVLKRVSEVKAMSKILKKAYTSGFSNEFIYNKYKDIQDFNFIKFVKEIQKDAQDLDIEGLESLTNFIDEQSIKVSSILEFDIVPTQEFYGYVTDKDNNVVDMKQFKSKFHANMWKKQTEIENKANGYTVKTDKTPTKIEEVEDKTSNFNRIANEYKQYAAKSYKEGKTAEVPFDFFVNSFAVIDNVSKTSSLNIHLRMVNNYIEKLRANKDAKTADELEKLRDYELQADSVIATKIRHFNSIYNLGGSVASAISNFTSIPMVVEPYLGRYGNDKSLTKLFAQISTDRKVLFGNLNSDQLAEHIATKYIKNGDKAQAVKDIKRLIEAGLLYDISDYDLAKVKEGIDLTGKFTNIKSVAVNAYMSPFAKSEAINKLVTGIAALDVAYKNSKDGFDFTKETIYATQGYYGKLGRPVWARSGVGQLLYQFKTYPLNYASLLMRLAGGDKKDKVAAGKMLGMLILLGGVKSIPFASDSGDLIDTFGRLFGFETTDSGKEVEDIMKSMLGDEAGLLLTYGIASEFGLPFNLQQRIAFNDIIPGTKLFDPAVKDKTQELKQIGGPTVSNTGNIMEGIKQFAKGNYYQSMYNVAPSAGKALLQGVTALTDDKFVDKNGKTITTATADEALIRILGFQPKNLAEVYRGIERIEVQKQNIEYFKSLVYDLLASSQIEKDMSKKILANRMIKEFNSQNPTTKIEINQSVLTRRINDRKTTLEERYKKQLPKELREEYEQITK